MPRGDRRPPGPEGPPSGTGARDARRDLRPHRPGPCGGGSRRRQRLRWALGEHVDTRGGSVPITVFLLDDHEIVRRGIAQLLETEDDIQVVGEAGTAAQALARIPALRPDVAILDVRLPDGEGVSVCREVRSAVSPPPACLMLTSFSDDEALFGAIMAGASGYLLKQVTGNDLIGAVRTVAAGGSLPDPRATARVLERLRHGD